MSTLLQPGDEVIIEHPVYEPLLRIAQYNQCNIVRLQRKLDEHWAISLERLQSLLTTKTRLIAISNLHNPSGAYIPEDQIATIGKIAAEVNAFVLVDEVYLDMMPGQQLPKRAFQLGDNILSTASFTKAWGVGRARFGWIMAHPDLIRNFHLFANLDYVNPPLIAEALAIVLLRRADFLQNRMLRHIQTTLPILKQWAEQETRIRWSEPPGGLIGYVQLPASIQSDTLMQHCVQKYDMNFSPGSFFEQNNFARLAIGASPDIVTAGLERFSAALTDLI